MVKNHQLSAEQTDGRIGNYLMGELVRDLGLEGQKQKEGTPTMGGLIIILPPLFLCFYLQNLIFMFFC